MSAERFAAWIDRYENAWRTAGTEPLRDLFTAGATYKAAPFDEPLRGLEAIAAFWEAEREGADEEFTLDAEMVATDVGGATGVARLEVRYGEPVPRTYRDLWIIELDEAGLCTAFEEWPFFPGRARAATP
jgi:hypothetical protein